MADREGNLRAVDWKDHEIRMQRILRLHYGAGGFALEPTRNSRHALSAGSMGGLAEYSRRQHHFVCRTCRANWTANGTQSRRFGKCSNPIGVVVPCHGVIGANGSLTGYGGGINRKRWLLEHEGIKSTVQNQGEEMKRNEIARILSGRFSSPGWRLVFCTVNWRNVDTF